MLGPNALMPALREIVDDPGRERRFRADHDELDPLALAEIDHRCMVGDVERHALGFARDAGIARRAPEFRHQRRSRDLPRQSVFAAAGTEQENMHEIEPDERFCRCRSHESAPRGKGVGYGCRAEAAMISCSVATWRAKAPRPAAVAVTVVCGFLPTKALSTAT